MSNVLEAVELGHVLRIDVEPARGEAYAMTWTNKNAPVLAWCPREQMIVFYDRSHAGEEVAPQGPHTRSYKGWHQRNPDASRCDVVPAKGKWKVLGTVTRIDYWSDKWGKDREYTHASRGGTKIKVRGTGKSALYVLKGSMRATNRGLIR